MIFIRVYLTAAYVLLKSCSPLRGLCHRGVGNSNAELSIDWIEQSKLLMSYHRDETSHHTDATELPLYSVLCRIDIIIFIIKIE